STTGDEHTESSIPFEEFHMAVNLPDEWLRFRSDGAVENIDEQQKSVLEACGLKNASISNDGELPPDGRTLSWVDHRGARWAISFIVENADPRITRSMLTHEKYHALCRLSPERLPVLHDAVQALGFSIDWDRYDEEMRALITQV